MTTIASTLQAVNARIAKAAADADRQAGEITLLAVSKTMPIAAIRAAHSAGQIDFGENYMQEALTKIEIFLAVLFSPSLTVMLRIISVLLVLVVFKIIESVSLPTISVVVSLGLSTFH